MNTESYFNWFLWIPPTELTDVVTSAFEYLSTISFSIKLASLLSTFLKFFISFFGGCFTAAGLPFWAFPTRGVTLAGRKISRERYTLYQRQTSLHNTQAGELTFGSGALDGSLTAVEGLTFEDTPRAAGWLLGTGFGCGGTWFEVFWGSLLLLDASVASVKPGQYWPPASLFSLDNNIMSNFQMSTKVPLT